ncbi:MAG TPA: discoidin domain-containing protein [Thermoanaerobaculia bacterium]|jgi:hypothetical protein
MNAERRTQNVERGKGLPPVFFILRSAFCVLRSGFGPALSLLLTLGLLSCNPAPKAAAPAAKAPAAAPDPERGNLLSLFAGATVVSRTSEMSLEASAVHAIDGDSRSGFISVPGMASTTLVYELGGLARVEKLEALSPQERNRPKEVRFESSLDGVTFTKATPPLEARYLRLTVESTRSASYVPTVQVRGTLVSPAPLQPLEGCWKINGQTARFLHSGAAVRGMIGKSIYLEGGAERDVYKLSWSDGPQYGIAAIAVSADGRRLSGAHWYHDPITIFSGEAWFGERADCDASFPAADFRLPAASKNPYVYEPAVLTAAPKKITVHEFREATPAANRGRAEKRVAEIRALLQQRGFDLSKTELAAAGSDRPWREVESETMREMMSVALIER